MAQILKEPKQDSVGLVIIITNDYSTTKELSTLNGTKEDGKALSEAFAKLNFTVQWEENVNGDQLKLIVKDIARLNASDCRCIIFVFSGHGQEGDYIFMQDNSKHQIYDAIVHPLLPKNAKGIGSIQKAFLIDACRGGEKAAIAYVPKGLKERLMDKLKKVSAEGNFLVAYSTLPKQLAYETDKGGVWLSTVATLLNEGKHLNSLGDFLTMVNKCMMEDNFSTAGVTITT